MATVANSEVIKHLVVLIADSRPHSRALLRSMLLQLEVKKIHEVVDGTAALEALATVNPDVMILDWGLPVLRAGGAANGTEPECESEPRAPHHRAFKLRPK